MRTEAAGDEGETVVQRAQRTAEGVGEARLEPAVRAGADPAEQRAALVRLAEDGVEAVHAPDGEHVGCVAAADVDDVLAEDVAPQVAHAAVEELEVLGLAVELREGAVKAGDVFGGVAA